ncbi:tetratricopeptide repeat protein [Microcoleus sp. herbarium5]|uniref:tetratricopeptide repeat protein n=1 Tax=Microcoleus sp. herbarium5 TaxID=3055434 RepID=UPI002FD043D8
MNLETTVIELNQGQQLFTEGNFEGAIAVYRQVLELNSSDSWAHHHMGEALAKLGQLDEAVTAYRHAIELKPDFSWSYHHLGDALAQQQQWEEAAEAFRKGIELNPEHFGTYVGLGKSLAKLGQLEEAIAAYRRASELNPDADWIHHALANVLQQRTQLDLAEAIASYRQIIELNPDNVETYHNLLQIQPDNSDIWLQLAEAFVRQEQMEEAITSYRRLVELSPCEQYYQQLGELLVKQEKWDEAIIAYQRAIEFNPESYLYYYQLGEVIYNRVMQNPESFFADYKIAELPYNKKDYTLFDNEPPDICFINDESFLQATSHLDEEAYVLEIFRVYYKREVSDDEVIRSAQWFREGNRSLRRLQGLKGVRNLPEFKILLSRSIISACLQESINAYRKATELNYNHYKSHYRIAEVLTKQGKSNEAVTVCYDISLHLAEQGSLNESVAFFRLREKINQPSLGLVCEYVWNDLNNINPFNKNSSYHQVEIAQDDAVLHFRQESHYRTIDINALTEKDKYFLKKLGLSIANLEIISKDNIFLEDIYINHFSSIQTQLKRKVARNPQYNAEWLGHTGMYLVQSIVETGYAYAVCPISGRVIRSNQSFFVFPSFFYRFVGDEVFYLLVGEWYNTRHCVYFPRWDLIVRFCYAPQINGDTINWFKAYCVTNWQSFKSYISNPEKQVAVIIGDLFNNLTHYLWDVAGFQYLDDNNLLDKIDKVLVGPHDFFNIGDLFPEIAKDKIEVFDNSINLYQSIIENNYCAVKLVECFIKEKLADRIYQASLKKCSKLFLEEVEQSTQNFPVLWITIRSSRRVWTSQVQGIANIIKKLYVDFPNLGIIFDGWSRTEKSSKNDEVSIAIEIAMMEQIMALIPAEINTYNAIGRMTYEKVVWVHAIDLHISSLGAGMCFTVWLVNKPGVAHGNTTLTEWETQPTACFHNCRENATERPVLLPLDKITDEDNSFWGTRNYDCDWNAIYDEVVKIINGLSKKDKIPDIN